MKHLPPRTMKAMQHVLDEAVARRDYWKQKYKSEVPSLKKELRRLRTLLKERPS